MNSPKSSKPKKNVDLEVLRSWKQRSKEQLTGRLAWSLMDGQDAALADLVSAQEEWERLRRTSSEELVEQRRFFLGRVMRSFLFFVLFVAGGIVAFLLGPITIVLVLAAGAALCLVWFCFVLLTTARRHVQWKYRMKLETEELPKRRRHAISEFRRLSALYVQYLYWAEILSEALHRPLGSELAAGDESEQSVDGEEELTSSHTRSLLIGQAVMSDRERNLLELRVARNAAERGWMMRSFVARRRDWFNEYKMIANAMSTQLSPEPEQDAEALPQVIYEIASTGSDEGVREIRYPLADFAKQYCAGLHAKESRNDIWAELGDRLGDNATAEYIDYVETRVKGLEEVSLENFLRGPLLTRRHPGFDSTHYVDSVVTRDGLDHTCWIGISEAVGLPEGYGGLGSAIEHPVHLANEHPIFASFRLEVSAPILLEQCKLIAPPPDEAKAGAKRKPSRRQQGFG